VHAEEQPVQVSMGLGANRVRRRAGRDVTAVAQPAAARADRARMTKRAKARPADAIDTAVTTERGEAGRMTRGRTRGGASFPAAPSRSGLPADYPTTLAAIRERIGAARLRAMVAANSAMVQLYWDIGHIILGRQQREGWGAKVIDRLSADLRVSDPAMNGLSPRNLKYMRAFAGAWPDEPIVQGVLAQLPWSQNITLLERLDDRETRIWYASQSLHHGWSQAVLAVQIQGGAHARHGRAVNNFVATLPPAASDMASQAFKDPYLFDFIGTAEGRRESEIERALVDHIQRFLLELGTGFAFVGRQVHLEFATRDYYLDLLFYHLKLRCYVVLELKAVPFDPAFVGKMNVYLSAVDDLLRHPDDKPTIGLLLCKSKDKVVVEYALRGFGRPIGVAQWATSATEALPPELKGSLPTIAEIEAELAASSITMKHFKRV
jgi:predicted nuclease of restriction endonuclease-like (RecB) superfamily